jgi:hypothetical protein
VKKEGKVSLLEGALKDLLECDIVCDIIHGLEETRHG